MKRPRSIALVSAVFIVTGVAGLLADIWPLVSAVRGAQLAALRAVGVTNLAPASGLHLLAIAGGVALRGGRNWARWLLVAWMLIHVGISSLHSMGEIVAHCVIFSPLLYLLFGSPARRFFCAPNKSAA
jgi:hypothetical protein